MFLLDDSKYLQHVATADNHIFYTDGTISRQGPGHVTWLRDMCRRPTLFMTINRKHFITQIEPTINILLDQYPQIQQVLFDHTGDPVYDRKLAGYLNNWARKKGIRTLFATSNWTKQQHSDLIEIFSVNMLITVRSIKTTLDLSPKKYQYSCLNRNPVWHRLLFYTMLKQRDLLDQSVYTFYDHDPYTGKKLTPEYYFRNKELLGDYYSECMENIGDFPLSWPDDPQGENDLGIDHPAYRDTQCNIVTESAADVEFTSEKIWKPIAAGQCFHVVGSAKTNAWLKSFGFETFDLDYDSTVNSITRLEQVVNQLSNESMWTPENLDKISHNYQLFFSGAVEKTILDPLVALLDQ